MYVYGLLFFGAIVTNHYRKIEKEKIVNIQKIEDIFLESYSYINLFEYGKIKKDKKNIAE